MNDSDVTTRTTVIGGHLLHVQMTHVPTGVQVTGPTERHTRSLLEVLVWDIEQREKVPDAEADS